MTITSRLPDFIIGGAPRSGTTYLAQSLDHHPAIYLAKPFIPEPKVFMGTPKPDSEYLKHYAELFREAPAGSLCGEKTSYYLECRPAFECIKRLLPKTKVIFIVREPVARAYSNYLWSTKNGLETLSFEEAIAMEGDRKSPLPPDKSYARPFDYLSRADYAELGMPYIKELGRDRVRFFLFEELERQPAKLLKEVQEFLGVDAIPLESSEIEIVNSAKEAGGIINPATEQKLRERMKPLVSRFATLTGLDISSWGYEGIA